MNIKRLDINSTGYNKEMRGMSVYDFKKKLKNFHKGVINGQIILVGRRVI